MFQQITIVGYLGNDPELRYTPNGQAVTSFNIAANYSYTNNAGTKVDETTWFKVSVWGAQAESVSQYLKKGRPALVVGRLRGDPQTGRPQIYTRKDGTPGASYEVTASNVRFLPGGGSGDYQANIGDDQGGYEDDEIPF